MASPGFGIRGHEDRGAKGASIEVPKAPYEEFYSREMSRRHCPEVSAYASESHAVAPCLFGAAVYTTRARMSSGVPGTLCGSALSSVARRGAYIDVLVSRDLHIDSKHCRPASSTGRLHGKLTAVNDHRTNQQTAFERYHGDKHFSKVLPTRWRTRN